MSRIVLPALLMVTSLPIVSPAQEADSSVFARAQQMVTSGQGDAGRAVVDSVLAATAPDRPWYAEALFWRATLRRNAADAERDYRQISVEYPLSPRAPESLLRLAQLEVARGDRAGARGHLERLQREHPTGSISTRAGVWLARLAFDDGDLAQGCAAASAARASLEPSDVELRNQLDYYAPRCANLAARDSAGGDRPVGAIADTAADRPERAVGESPSASPGTGTEYSVQIAAYSTRTEAAALARRLSARGFAARVVGDERPYRVRVGRYPTRARADEAVRRMRAASLRGIVVEAERR